MKMKNHLWVAALAILTMSACTTSRYNLKLNKADWTAPEKPEARPMDRVPAATIEGLDGKHNIDQVEVVKEKKVKTEKIDNRDDNQAQNSSINLQSVPKEASPSNQQSPIADNAAKSDMRTYEASDESAMPEVAPVEPENTTDDVATILLVILALFIPPLAVFIFEQATGRFWLNLVLFLLGIFAFGGAGIGTYFIGIGGLLVLIAIIHAILIVLGVI